MDKAGRTIVGIALALLGTSGCEQASQSEEITASRVVTFRVHGGTTAFMGTTDQWLFDGEKALSGLTTMRVELPTDPADIEFVAGSKPTPEHFVRCKVGTELRTTILWDGEQLTCETR